MSRQQLNPIAVLGAGSWGTALALYLARQGQVVRLWSIMPDEVSAMLEEKTNNRFLPGYEFPKTILPTGDLAQAIDGCDDILIVVPSIGYRDTLKLLQPLLQPKMRIVSATKGLDESTYELPNEIVENILGKHIPFAVLSGPSFAREVAAGLPTAVVIASQNQSFQSDLVTRFESEIFSVQKSDDIIGVEIGGVVKNVIAIATGISDGLELGANSRSAVITFGLEEIIRLSLALGGRIETMVGLAGVGDLILTCSDNQSRNRRMGLAMGKGLTIKEAEREIGQVVEGKRNAELVVALAKRHQVSMPVCENILLALQGKLTADKAISAVFAQQSSHT